MGKSKKLRPVLMAIPTLCFAFPLCFLFVTSLEKKGFANYLFVLTEIRVERNIMNSLIVAVITVLIVLAITLPASFAFSKMKFPGQNILFLIVLMAMMIPGISIAVPMVKIIRSLNLVNNYFSLILPYVAINSPIALILGKNFMDGLSAELMEAAKIDGCTTWTSFLHIYLPLAVPVSSIISVFTFLNCWNEFVYAKLFMQKETMQMVSTIPIKFQADMYTNIPALFAGLVIVQLPVLILYLMFQNTFREGLTAGAVKG
ncbi:carbohydrate ABC transporter permease [Muricomes intestini]|uniref:carbohydrate ABC transporter permease n=1 Tax=Muricomes intestini TaxID=1796634 RepID=UPI002FDA3D16